MVMGDGGFQIEDFNKQEIITKQLVLCQFITALNVLRKGGNFVCKCFDLFSPFSISLFFVLYQHFEYVGILNNKKGILKPFASRPANSERYVVCKGLRSRKPIIVKYLMEINTRLLGGENITEVVDPKIISQDTEFTDYITSSNIFIAKKQIYSLTEVFIEITENIDKKRGGRSIL
jgi:cap1 methyltransferase